MRNNVLIKGVQALIDEGAQLDRQETEAQEQAAAEREQHFSDLLTVLKTQAAAFVPADLLPYVDWPNYENWQDNGTPLVEFSIRIPEFAPIRVKLGYGGTKFYVAVGTHCTSEIEGSEAIQWLETFRASEEFDSLAHAIYRAYQVFPRLEEARERYRAAERSSEQDPFTVTRMESDVKTLLVSANQRQYWTDALLANIADRLTAIGLLMLMRHQQGGD